MDTAYMVRIGSKLALIGMLLALAGAVALAASGLGVQLDLWHFRTGFTIMLWSFWTGAGAALIALLGLILGKGKPPKMLATALMGIAVGTAVMYIPWNWKQTAAAVPPIHDITTDVHNPPSFVAVRALRKADDNPVEYDGPNVAAQQLAAYPDIQSLFVAADKNKTFAAAENAVKSMGLEVVATDAAEGRIEATHTSLFYGFKDDIVVRVLADGTKARVDVRSKSRVGRSDLGQNAKRVRTLIQKVQANLE